LNSLIGNRQLDEFAKVQRYLHEEFESCPPRAVAVAVDVAAVLQ